MSIIDGLRAMVPDRSYALDGLTGTQEAYEWALNDVREVLRSDETVKQIAAKVPWGFPQYRRERIVREVLAALAGGDQ